METIREGVMEKISKYFIAIVPSSPIQEEVMEMKVHFKEAYKSKGALNSPAHITLHMPFEWKSAKEDKLAEELKQFAMKEKSVEIALDGFGSFPPRVIFVKPETSEALSKLQKNLSTFCRRELQLFNSDYQDRPFHPHMTIGFRDLKPLEFTRAWDEFRLKPYRKSFVCNQLALLKHDGREWKVIHEFPLDGRL